MNASRRRPDRAFWRELLHGDGGAVTMEYVLLCLLVASASIIMIVTFSRAVVRRMALVSYAMAGYEPDVLENLQERFRDDTKDDSVVAGVYSDYMHNEKVDKVE